ncbi:MAG: hypothetical protein NTY68_00270 [Candidatus Micrarchaeota archaeon]|nr:hypothetical protein [Candidatus Micrarchaeota archaeon]
MQASKGGMIDSGIPKEAGMRKALSKGLVEKKNILEKSIRRFSDYRAFCEICNGYDGDVVKAFDHCKKEAMETAEQVAQTAFTARINRESFISAVDKFCNDSFSLVFALVLMEGSQLEDSIYSKKLEIALAKKGRSMLNSLGDYQDLLDPKSTRERVLETAILFRKEFPDALSGKLETFISEMGEGKYDDVLGEISRTYGASGVGEIVEFQPYFFVNYRQNAIFETVTLALLNAYKGKEKNSELIGMFSTSGPEIFMYPALFAPSFGTDELMRFRSQKGMEEFKPEPELDTVLSEMDVWKDVPLRDKAMMTWQIGSIKDALIQMPSANIDIANRIAEHEIPFRDIRGFVFKRMIEKKISPALDVIPAGCHLSDADRERVAQSSRTVHIGINDTFSETEAGKSISMLFHGWSDRTRVTNTIENALACTDGQYIYTFPYYSRMPTKDMNLYLLFNIERHEIGHIIDGSFNYELGQKPSINLFSALEANPVHAERYGQKGEKEIRAFQDFLNEVMEMTERKMDSTKDHGNRMSLKMLYHSIASTVDLLAGDKRYKDSKYVGLFASNFGQGYFQSVENILDDHRVDRLFFEGKGRDPVLYETDDRDVSELRKIYQVATYMRALQRAVSIHNSSKDSDKKSNAAETLFLRAMLDKDAFDTLLGKSVDPLFGDICNAALSKAYHGEDTPRRMNDVFGATMEFMALSIIFDESIQPPKVSRSGKGKSGQGKGGQSQGQPRQGEGSQSQGKPGQERSPGKGEQGKESPKEGEKGDQKGSGGENRTPGSSQEGGNADGHIDKKGDGEVIITRPGSREENKGGVIIEKEEGIFETKELRASKVEMFKQFFMDLRVDRIKVMRELGRRGSKADVGELIKFMHERGSKEARFLEKRLYEKGAGSNLEARPIDIYIGIDTSGSMKQDPRPENYKTIALELLAGYKEVKAEMMESNITLRLISVASEGEGTKIKPWDATNELGVERTRDGYRVSYKFTEIGGGTELPEMIGKFQEFVAEIKNNTVKSIVSGRKVMNPSVLILYITDFGDNRGDLEGVVKATSQFGDFAEKYRHDSKTINFDSNEAGIATVFVMPDTQSDNDEIEEAVKKATGGCSVRFHGDNEKDLIDALHKVRPVLEGLKATNIVKP